MNQKRQTLTNVQKTSDDIGVHWTRRFFNPVTGQPDNTGSAGLEKAGWARLFYPSLDQICSGPNGQLNPNVVDNFLSNLKQYHDEGRKVLFNFNAYRLDRSVASAIHQPSGYAYDSAEYLTWVRDRLAELIPKIPKGHLQAIECANEPPPDNDMQWLAGLSRVFYVQFKKLYSPDVVVCSPAFQGGSWQQFYKWLTANADQVAVQDQPKNDGSLGERWMDVIAWHPYGTLDKMSLAMVQDHRLASDIAMGAMAGIRMAMEPRLQISSTSVWAGKPMPPIWATEFNISGVTDTLTDDDFRFQLLSQAQRASALRYLLLCAFAAGFDKAFVYAVDHFRYYPPVLASADAGTQGRVRIRLSAGRAFSGDTLTVSGAPSNSGLNRTWSVIKPSVDGTGVELQDSVYKANYDGLSVSWMRYQLGGWQSQFSAVVTEITSAPMNAGVTVGTVAGSPWVQTVRPWVQIGTGLVEDLVPPIS